MTALRHPNVVLFMAACTKLPHMCIVMEYMGLGSLYDVCSPLNTCFLTFFIIVFFPFSNILCKFNQLLHNELIPDLPMALRIKMAYHAAKGMHFLHSSGKEFYIFASVLTLRKSFVRQELYTVT